MGVQNIKQNGLLSSKEKVEASSSALKEYFSTVKGQEFHQEDDISGAEIEGHVHNADGSPVEKGLVPDLIQHKPERTNITGEYARSQLEIITRPRILERGSIDSAIQELTEAFEYVQGYAKSRGGTFVPQGIASSITPEDLTEDIIADGTRYRMLTREALRAKTKCVIRTSSGTFRFKGLQAYPVVSSTHANQQAHNATDAARRFNYSLMIAPVVLALSANSSVFNKKRTELASQQMQISEQSIPPSSNGPRCIFYPKYINSPDEYFEDFALRVDPVFDPRNEHGVIDNENALKLLLGSSYSWVRLRTGKDPKTGKGHYRTEIRTINVQPTIPENMALVQMCILGVPALMESEALLDIEYVKENFKRAVHKGIDAKMYWDIGKGVKEYPASTVARHVLNAGLEYGCKRDLLSDSEKDLFELLRVRVDQRMTPGKKFAMELDERGFEYTFRDYKVHVMMGIPYISRE